MTLAAVKTCTELADMPEEYRLAVKKLVVSHAINELYGAKNFEEPAIGFAPNPHAKALTCRIAMEEYSHHVRFYELGREMGIPDDEMHPDRTAKRKLTMFDTPIEGWADFVTLKLFGDLAEILQVEDLAHATFQPLQKLARVTMPEERFHTQFGEQYVTELCRTDAGHAAVQAALDRIFPALPGCFGAAQSKNNATFRKWGLKARTNEEMRANYLTRAGALATRFGLVLPAPTGAALAP
jgi:ring-1,2-phenylacetyl-CoA epoxidase subunit PaaA